MKTWIRCLVSTTFLGFAANAAAEIIFYENGDFRGQSFAVNRPIPDFFNYGFNDRASSVSVRSGTWQVCSDSNFRGQCVTLGPGDYPTLTTFGLNQRVSSVRMVDAANVAPAGRGRIVLFDTLNMSGNAITVDRDVDNFDRIGFNDRAVSAVVDSGTWQLCEHADYRGSCMTLEPGRYPNLGDLGLRVSSARVVANRPVVTGAPPGPPPARAVLYSQRGFGGPSLVVDRAMVRNLQEYHFNDRAASLRVESGYWMFCSDANFEGECRTFGPGEYPSLPPDMNSSISSARRISHDYPYRERPTWGH